ncbi:MAG: hypothetical protein ACLQU1_17770 [Bryobacteraceae bacterium]
MKPAEAILAAGIAILLAGCLLRGTPKTAQAAPATPKPAVAPAPAPPPQPLSIPQTHVELPPPQPVNPEALPTTQPQPEEPAPAPAAPPKPPRSRVAQPARSDPPAQPPPVTAEPAERPPVQEIVSAEELRQLPVDAQRDRQEATRLLDRASSHRLTRQQQQLKKSIESFLQLSSDAEKRGDLRQARELAGRALVLAKELQP